MKVLFCASEVSTLYQLGGLGDVAYALPLALNKLGVDVRIALPYHIEITHKNEWEKVDEFKVSYAEKEERVEIWKASIAKGNVPVYLFKNETYLSVHSDVSDGATEKFAFFSLAISRWVCGNIEFKPDLIHLNDWHVSLVHLILKCRFKKDNFKTLLTIHNINFQGVTKLDLLNKLEIKIEDCQTLVWDGSDGDINLLMEGIIHADKIVAVSPTYAKEILTPDYGAYLDPVLNSLSGKLSGILNGIDGQMWNPKIDEFIDFKYGADNLEEGKRKNRQILTDEFGLNLNCKMLIGYVGRVDHNQKGVELIIEAVRSKIVGTSDYPFIFLGTGDTWLEDQLTELESVNNNFKAICRFDEKLAHRIYASSELMVMPSKYEPCGLVQMIAMKYGTIPIVRKTGGLADTVEEGVTGFLFDNYKTSEFKNKIIASFEQLQNIELKLKIQNNCINKDFSWDQSAKNYIKTYQKVIWKDL